GARSPHARRRRPPRRVPVGPPFPRGDHLGQCPPRCATTSSPSRSGSRTPPRPSACAATATTTCRARGAAGSRHRSRGPARADFLLLVAVSVVYVVLGDPTPRDPTAPTAKGTSASK